MTSSPAENPKSLQRPSEGECIQFSCQRAHCQMAAVQDTSKKSPMQLINEVPPIKFEGRIVTCEGDSNPALGHLIKFICLDLEAPAVCKYCALRYVQDHHH